MPLKTLLTAMPEAGSSPLAAAGPGAVKSALLLACCLALGAAGAWLVARLPWRRRLLDLPNERSSHLVPTPRGGGVGILAGLVLAGFLLGAPLPFLAGAVLVSLLSFAGDLCPLSVRVRLAGQAGAALLFLVPLAGRLEAAFGLGAQPAAAFLLLGGGLLFVVGTANFYNFMDGIDGLAGLSGVLAFGLLAAFALGRPETSPAEVSLALLCLCLAGGCLGFLPFNAPRARVFMGDGGSVLLGFLFAGLVLSLARTWPEIVTMAAFLFPFYADELTTMVVRLRDGEDLTASHRRHLYQLLVNELGIAHWKVSAAYGALQLAVGLAALSLSRRGPAGVASLWGVCFLGFSALSALVRRRAGEVGK